jgi:putative redox protein
MDAPEKSGGEDHGPIPKPFILTALSGGTGMDLIAILRKAGTPADDLTIIVQGEISKQPPIEYTAIHVNYQFKGMPEYEQQALEAVTKSQEQYCGVSHMLKKILPVTWEVNYNSKQIFNNNPEKK